MKIDFDKFVSWAETRFDDIRISGSEIKVNSIFCDDTKRKLWCNPYGGKNNRDYGVYHCWKTDKTGSLVSLVMEVDKCSYQQALETLGGEDISLEELERRVLELFEKKAPKVVDYKTLDLQLPPFSFKLEELAESNYYRLAAETYLINRKLPTDSLYICTDGDYKNRIIIPYYDRDGNLIYYNARDLNPKSQVKYLGPPAEEVGIGKGDVLYFPRWPQRGEKVYLTEGEFDALTLFHCGLTAGAFGGKNLSEKQLLILDESHIVLCLDNDKAGRNAVPKMCEYVIENGYVKDISYVFPPGNFKDWNELLATYSPNVIKEYVLKQSKTINYDKLIEWQIQKL